MNTEKQATPTLMKRLLQSLKVFTISGKLTQRSLAPQALILVAERICWRSPACLAHIKSVEITASISGVKQSAASAEVEVR
jgi:hypothetical protein